MILTKDYYGLAIGNFRIHKDCVYEIAGRHTSMGSYILRPGSRTGQYTRSGTAFNSGLWPTSAQYKDNP